MARERSFIALLPEVSSPSQEVRAFVEESSVKALTCPTWTLPESTKPSCTEARDWQQFDSTIPQLSRSPSSSTISSPCSSDYAPTDSGSDVSSQGGDSLLLASEYSAFENLPVELLEEILSFFMQDAPPSTYGPRNEELVACLLTSRALSGMSLRMLYRNISIPHSRIFAKMLSNIIIHPELGKLVRRLNFSHYNSMGFGRTRRRSSEILNITPDTLLQALSLFPNLREFLVHEHLDVELNDSVLRKLFSMKSLHALDFCACSSPVFVNGMEEVITGPLTFPHQFFNLKRLSLHECSTLQAPIFESLLPRLPHLTHLDVAHTLITDQALSSIPHSARLTHLNLGRCTRILGSVTVDFLTTHPAVRSSLVYLNLMADPSRFRLLFADDVTNLLPRLPPTLRSLELSGAKLNASHLSDLVRLITHLEELGIGYSDLDPEQHLRELLVPQYQSPRAAPSTLRYLNLHGMDSVTPLALARLTSFVDSFSSQHLGVSASASTSTSTTTSKLQVLELDPSVFTPSYVQNHNRSSSSTVGRGQGQQETWVLKEVGRRVCYMRRRGGSRGEANNDGDDNGERKWKMGAREWGMRKMPVAVQEVGGMYGFYMFRR